LPALNISMVLDEWSIYNIAIILEALQTSASGEHDQQSE